jgi:FG-GAP-like repeat
MPPALVVSRPTRKEDFRRRMIAVRRRASFALSVSLCLALAVLGAGSADAASSSSPTTKAAPGDQRASSETRTSSDAAAAPAFRLGTAARPFGWSTAIGDFNSDGMPDLVVADHVGRRAGGYAYRIEFSMSGTAPTDVFFESTFESLTITTLDIDHDNDLDIVVGRPLNGGAVGVWLNDGHGHFIPASVGLFPSAINARQTLAAADQQIDAAAIEVSPRPHHGDIAALGAAISDAGDRTIAPRAASRPSSFLARRSSPRGPPHPSTT